MAPNAIDTSRLVEVCLANDCGQESCEIFRCSMRRGDDESDFGYLAQDIAGMRDKLVHDYFGVDLAAVWLAATPDVPALLDHVRRILP